MPTLFSTVFDTTTSRRLGLHRDSEPKKSLPLPFHFSRGSPGAESAVSASALASVAGDNTADMDFSRGTGGGNVGSGSSNASGYRNRNLDTNNSNDNSMTQLGDGGIDLTNQAHQHLQQQHQQHQQQQLRHALHQQRSQLYLQTFPNDLAGNAHSDQSMTNQYPFGLHAAAAAGSVHSGNNSNSVADGNRERTTMRGGNSGNSVAGDSTSNRHHNSMLLSTLGAGGRAGSNQSANSGNPLQAGAMSQNTTQQHQQQQQQQQSQGQQQSLGHDDRMLFQMLMAHQQQQQQQQQHSGQQHFRAGLAEGNAGAGMAQSNMWHSPQQQYPHQQQQQQMSSTFQQSHLLQDQGTATSIADDLIRMRNTQTSSMASGMLNTPSNSANIDPTRTLASNLAFGGSVGGDGGNANATSRTGAAMASFPFGTGLASSSHNMNTPPMDVFSGALMPRPIGNLNQNSMQPERIFNDQGLNAMGSASMPLTMDLANQLMHGQSQSRAQVHGHGHRHGHRPSSQQSEAQAALLGFVSPANAAAAMAARTATERGAGMEGGSDSVAGSASVSAQLSNQRGLSNYQAMLAATAASPAAFSAQQLDFGNPAAMMAAGMAGSSSSSAAASSGGMQSAQHNDPRYAMLQTLTRGDLEKADPSHFMAGAMAAAAASAQPGQQSMFYPSNQQGVSANFASPSSLMPTHPINTTSTAMMTPPRPRPKKKRLHKKKPADMPRRPLSAYNLFFSEERERILKELDPASNPADGSATAGTSTTTGTGKDGGAMDKSGTPSSSEEGGKKKVPRALLRPLLPSEKKRRPHRKTHGKISFRLLAQKVGQRWKALPETRRKYYQKLAQEDMKRQKQAMEEYYKRQAVAKPTEAAVAKEEERDEEVGTETRTAATKESAPTKTKEEDEEDAAAPAEASRTSGAGVRKRARPSSAATK